tara:strand:- start:862 stop:1026 length:165 start_codon:yes stop_codon:yes gene_type:complete
VQKLAESPIELPLKYFSTFFRMEKVVPEIISIRRRSWKNLWKEEELEFQQTLLA